MSRQVRVGGGKDQVTESKYSTLQSFTDAYGGWDRAPKSNGTLAMVTFYKPTEIIGNLWSSWMRWTNHLSHCSFDNPHSSVLFAPEYLQFQGPGRIPDLPIGEISINPMSSHGGWGMNTAEVAISGYIPIEMIFIAPLSQKNQQVYWL